ncbi:hypothetical protein HHK36_002705 [Tetracentron sinense]|uniref:Uncharacterized protein n=1 Tax=Tetracentron sinense TaxID=13715 RepID=A0A834ZRZ0_TETSI|nr:hypothetical protein HHK36_002705 [Tetracentron sinense]
MLSVRFEPEPFKVEASFHVVHQKFTPKIVDNNVTRHFYVFLCKVLLSPLPKPRSKEERKKEMSGSFLRHGGKRCINRLIERRSIVDFCVSTKAPTLQQQQQSRAYARSSSIFKKINDSGIYPYSLSFSSSSYSSSKSGFIGWYLGKIQSRPLLTKSVTSALIYTVADLSSQFLEELQTLNIVLVSMDATFFEYPSYGVKMLTSLQMITKQSFESFDSIRTLRMAGYGMLILGPSLHFWFNFVSKVLPKRDIFTTLKKIIMGQTIYGPFITAVFFSLNAGVQGENGAEIAARLKRDLIPTLRNGLMYWPMCDFITFKFIPVQLQPLVSNSFSYLWTIYITYMASLKKADAE